MAQFGFIGCGNMGSALVRAAVKNVAAEDVWVANRTSQKVFDLAEELGCTPSTNKDIARFCEYIFLCVKPQMMGEVLEEISGILAAREDRFVLVSIAAGVSMERVRSMAGANIVERLVSIPEYPVIRLMPNMAAQVAQSITLMCSAGVTDEELAEFNAAMAGAGLFCPVQEGQMDAGTAVASCGIAYAAMFAEALADGGVQCGLPRATAQLMANQMMLGTAALLLEKGMDPAVLKNAVCSPGGATIEGVHALEEGAMRACVANAVTAACKRSQEL